MQTFQLYIGANNRTKRLETAKIRRVMPGRHDGFTLVPVTGYWQGERENSVLVIVNDDPAKVRQTIAILKAELQQEAIGVQRVADIEFA